MIQVEGISKSFGSKEVLKNISFQLHHGELVGLVGPSGGGKSVLLKLLGGILPVDSGNICFASDEPGARTGVGFSFQEGALFDSFTVLENVMFPLQEEGRRDMRRAISQSDAAEQAYEILQQVGLAKAIHKLPGQLSGGMRRRVGIARALVARPELVLLDDPTGGLDPVAARVIIELIRGLHKLYDPTIIIVSHDIRRLLPSVERLLCLFDGRISCDTPVSRLLEQGPQEVLAFLQTRFDFSMLSVCG